MLPTQVIQIHPLAPAKPPEGAPCNGCGICCLAEPCPVGILLSGTRSGPCRALRWQDGPGRYVCGAIVEPQGVLPPWLRYLASPALHFLPKLVRRWVAAGQGCDSSLEQQGPPDRHHRT